MATNQYQVAPNDDVHNWINFNFNGLTFDYPMYVSGNILTDPSLLNSEVSILNNGPFIGGTSLQNGQYNVPILIRFTQAKQNVTPPILTLVGSTNITLYQKNPYIELGSSASDIIDGNMNVVITGSVDINTVGTYILTYTATDSSRNTSTATRTIKIIANLIAPVLTLNGTNSMIIVVLNKYTELGANAIDTAGNIVPVIITGTVNTQLAGKYILTYTATDRNGNVSTLTRTINVNLLKPVIVLNGLATVNLFLNTPYTDPKASAIDTYGTNLNVIISGTINYTVVGTYILTYTATDSSGNSSSITRTIILTQNPSLPVITLNGSNKININLNDAYLELGALANDPLNPKIDVVISGNVNTKIPGSYIITYTATDNNNIATATRIVTVTDPSMMIPYTNNNIFTYISQNGNGYNDDVLPLNIVNSSFTVPLHENPRGVATDYAYATYLSLTYSFLRSNSFVYGNPFCFVFKTRIDTSIANLNNLNYIINNCFTITNGLINLGYNTIFTDPKLTAINNNFLNDTFINLSWSSGNIYRIELVDINGNIIFNKTTTANDIRQGNDMSSPPFVISGPGMKYTTGIYYNKQGYVDYSVYRSYFDLVFLLNGNAKTIVQINSPYYELGVIATNFNGDIIPVNITGTVNITKLGNYTITYTILSSNNTYTLTRSIIVVNDASIMTLYTPNMIASYNFFETWYQGADPQFTGNDWIVTGLTPRINYGWQNNPGFMWALADTYLDSINFNYDSSWCFVILGSNVNTNNYNAKDWHTNIRIDHYDKHDPNLRYYIDNYTLAIFDLYASQINSNGIASTSNAILNSLWDYNAFINTKIYYNISYNISTKIIKIEVVDTNGKILGTANSPPFTYSLKNSPFTITLWTCVMNYYTGVYYNSSGYVPYSIYNKYFTQQIANSTPPVITPNGSISTTILLNQPYTELGAIATDSSGNNVNVIISGTVNSQKLGSYAITYTAIDSNNNYSSIVSTVFVKYTPPVITLNGNKNMIVYLNSKYIEPGATAQDPINNNLNVKINGTVDTSKPGVYTITYTATDYGSPVTATRLVTVMNDNLMTPFQTGMAWSALNTQIKFVNNACTINSSTTFFPSLVYLESINFIAQSSWCFVFKLNGNNQTLYNIGTSINCNINNNNVGSFQASVNNNSIDNSAFKNDFFINISNNYVNNTNTILVEYLDINGNILYTITSSKLNNNDIWFNNWNPFAIISLNPIILTHGIYYNGNGHVNYLQFKPFFNSPFILNGSPSTIVGLNNSYIELGVFSKDINNNNVTYTTTGTVDSTKVGQYLITYTRSDTNNKQTLQRYIIVRNDSSIMTLYNSNILFTTHAGGSSDILYPIFTGNDWTLTTGNTGLQNSDRQFNSSFTLPYFKSINFNFKNPSSFSFVMLTTKFIPSISNANEIYNIYSLLGSDNITAMNLNNYTDGTGIFSQEIIHAQTINGTTYDNTIFNAGVYINLAYQYETDTFIFEMVDINGNVINKITKPFTKANAISAWSNLSLPVVFLMLEATMIYNTGIYYNSTGYVPYSVYSKFFKNSISANIPPIITINGSINTTSYLNGSYSELSASAIDSSGNIVNVITSGTVDLTKLGTYSVTYIAIDTNGNISTSVRNVSVIYLPPVITLNGDNTMTVFLNTSYVEPGATGSDVLNANLTVSIAGQVNTSIPGKYTLKYTTSDYSITTNAYRTVNVIDPNIMTPWNLSMIHAFYDSFYQNDNLFTNYSFLQPDNLSKYGATAIAPSLYFLESINFKCQSSWCFVFKCKKDPLSTYATAFDFGIGVNTELVNWGGNFSCRYVNPNTLIKSNGGYNNTPYTSQTVSTSADLSVFATDFFISISQNYQATGNSNILIEISDINGNIKFSTKSNDYIASTWWMGPYNPITINSRQSLLYTHGIYYNASGYVPYSVYYKYFNTAFSLNGSSSIVTGLNYPYIETGVFSKDINNNDVAYTTTGTVDTTKVGNYSIVYKRSDNNYIRTLIREVIVKQDSSIMIPYTSDIFTTGFWNQKGTDIVYPTFDNNYSWMSQVSPNQWNQYVWVPSMKYNNIINLNYNNFHSWCFVIFNKPTLQTVKNNNNIWGTNEWQNVAYQNYTGALNYSLSKLDYRSWQNAYSGVSPNVTCYGNQIKNTVFTTSLLNQGTYTVFSFDYDPITWPNNLMRVEITDINGNILYTEYTQLTSQSINYLKTWPEIITAAFSVLMTGASMTYKNGIYYNSNGYVPYSVYSKYFTTPIINYIAPVINLNGSLQISMLISTAYTELGATSTDFFGNTVPVIVAGTVDTTAIGNYSILYTSIDTNGNVSSVTRIVTVTN